MQTKEAYKAIA